MTSIVFHIAYYHFRKIVWFTWVTVFILLNRQQWKVALKVSGDIDSNLFNKFAI